MIVSGRRGVTPVTETSTGIGDQTFYVASVPGGKADLELNFVAGVAQSLTATGGRSLELFAYATGAAPAFTAGYGWNGAGALITPHVRRVGVETFETYAAGSIGGSGLTDGTGWNGTAALFSH